MLSNELTSDVNLSYNISYDEFELIFSSVYLVMLVMPFIGGLIIFKLGWRWMILVMTIAIGGG